MNLKDEDLFIIETRESCYD